jgi:hypothetical protein
MRLLILALAFFALPSFALQIEYRLNTASTNITTSYPDTPQLTGFTQMTTVQIYNSTNQELEVNCSSGSVKPSPCTTGTCSGSFHVPSGASLSSPDASSISGSCFIRANSSTATSGVLYAVGWGW